NLGSGTLTLLPGNNFGFFKIPTDESFLANAYTSLLNHPIDPAGLSAFLSFLAGAEQARLTGPGGATDPLAIGGGDPSTHQTLRLVFAPVSGDGTFTLTVGPNSLGNNIKDFIDQNGTFRNTGNAMNQNQNLVNGEFPADRFTGTFAQSGSDVGRFISGL